MRYHIFLLLIILCSKITGAQSNQIKADTTYYKLDDRLSIRTIYVQHENEYNYGILEIYELNADKRKHVLIQRIDSIKVGLFFGLDTFMDFDNDGFKDIKVVYGTGARGSNTLDYIFLQKKSHNSTPKFKYLKGSDYPPNLFYDSDRDVITSMMFHGGVSFVDYKIEDDSLIEQSWVEVYGDSIWTIRHYYLIDAEGKRTLQKVDSVQDYGDGVFSRE